MRLHANARLGPRGRQVMVERVEAGWPVAQAAEAAGASGQTCRKWLARYRHQGPRGLQDRPSVAHRSRIARAASGSRRSWRCGASG